MEKKRLTRRARTQDCVISQLDGAVSDDNDLESSEIENDSDNEGINLIKNEYAVRLLLTNARSLCPKTDSLRDAFDSLGLNVACVTETWYGGGSNLREHLSDVEGSSGIQILHKSRDGRTKRAGGGVVVAFDLASCNLKRRGSKHMPSQFEVMCVAGLIGKVARKVVIFVVYVPPTTKAGELKELQEALAVDVGAAMKSFKNPLVLVTGDFNHRDVGGALNEVGDFVPLATGPTRGTNTIDLIYSNAHLAHKETKVLPPLETKSGARSDHGCIFTEVEFPPERDFKWITKLRRTRDPAREEAFAHDMCERDWSDVDGTGDVDEMAVKMEEVIGELTEKHFPLERVRKRSNESPWITKRVKRLWKRKIRLYKKGGKSGRLWDTDRKLKQSLADARNGFVEKLLEEGNTGRSFYSATKKLATAAPTPQWSVCDLFPGKGPAAVSHEVLQFYGNISTTPAAPMPEISCLDGGLGEFTEERMVDLLKNIKKTESRVEGDPLAHMVRRFPRRLRCQLPKSSMRSTRAGSGQRNGRPSTSQSSRRVQTRGVCLNAETLAARRRSAKFWKVRC